MVRIFVIFKLVGASAMGVIQTSSVCAVQRVAPTVADYSDQKEHRAGRAQRRRSGPRHSGSWLCVSTTVGHALQWQGDDASTAPSRAVDCPVMQHMKHKSRNGEIQLIQM